MKKEAADQKRIAEEEKIKASMEQAKRQEDEKNLEKYVVGLLFIHLFWDIYKNLVSSVNCYQ